MSVNLFTNTIMYVHYGIHSSISEDTVKMVACVLVGSRLYYTNSVACGNTKKAFLGRKHF